MTNAEKLRMAAELAELKAKLIDKRDAEWVAVLDGLVKAAVDGSQIWKLSEAWAEMRDHAKKIMESR